MLRLQVDDTALLRDSQVGGRGAVEGELGSGIPQAPSTKFIYLIYCYASLLFPVVFLL